MGEVFESVNLDTLLKVDNVLMEAVAVGTLSEDEYQVYTESFTTAPIKKYLKKLEKIRKNKPDEYTDTPDVKEFVDKYYDDIKKCANILEKEPAKLRKDEIANVVAIVVALIAAYSSYGMLVNTILAGSAIPVAAVVILVVSCLFVTFESCIWCVIRWCRTTNNSAGLNELTKIKNALRKINRNKLDKKYAKKVSDMITAIDDAQTELMAKMKSDVTVKSEAVDDVKLNDAVAAKRLEIYEACNNGFISLEEREMLLDKLRTAKVYAEAAYTIDQLTSSPKEKYDQIRLALYEKCENGEISVEEREAMIQEAYENYMTEENVNTGNNDLGKVDSKEMDKVVADAQKDIEKAAKDIKTPDLSKIQA